LKKLLQHQLHRRLRQLCLLIVLSLFRRQFLDQKFHFRLFLPSLNSMQLHRRQIHLKSRCIHRLKRIRYHHRHHLRQPLKLQELNSFHSYHYRQPSLHRRRR
jgi:hypothetical protein